MYNIIDYGAVSDISINSTSAVQQAVEACKKNGGGCVFVPCGTYMIASVRLYSNIHFLFEAGAKFFGSNNPDDFDPREQIDYALYQDASHSYICHSMFWADGCENISFSGFGTIDMQSVWEKTPIQGESEWCSKRAAKIFGLKNCFNISINDLNLLRATDVAVYLAGCEKVRIHRLNLNVNIDGISPDCCKDVVISDCIVRSGDDGIVLKSSYVLNRKQVCENVVISNCIISSRFNAIKLGTESIGGFRNISINNCSIYNTFASGVALEITDGGEMDSITISNITMKNTGNPFFIILSDRRKAPADIEMGSIQNITIQNVTATGPYMPWKAPQSTALWNGKQLTEPLVLPSTITGQPNKKIRNISLTNIIVTVPGGGSAKERDVVLPEITKLYPENSSFGDTFPTYGFFFRHVENLMISNVYVDTIEHDERDPFIYEDITDLNIIKRMEYEYVH